MAEGRSNAAIAEKLVVTDGAVEKHISSILGKLNLPPSTPTTAACWPCWPGCATTPAERAARPRAPSGR